MRIACHNHFGTANVLLRALLAAGHELTPADPGLFLIDIDSDVYFHRELIDVAHGGGAVVLQYPHGAPMSSLVYDALYDPYERVNGQLTHAEGEIEFLRRINVQRPARAIGWSYCPQLPFRGSGNPRRVLFAPTHPNGDGSIRSDQGARNARMFSTLLRGPWELTVRFLGERPDDSGLWASPKARYVRGAMDLSTTEIDEADVVVAGSGTFPTLSVARGVPTVVYGQHEVGRGNANDEPVPLRRLPLYEDLITYPYDSETRPLEEAIYAACSDEATEWRRNWIGQQFDPLKAATLVEEFVRDLQALLISA